MRLNLDRELGYAKDTCRSQAIPVRSGMASFGYARVFPDGQSLDLQVEALRAAGCRDEAIYRETVRGARADRTQLARLLSEIGDGDVLVVSRLDRLARSTRDLLDIFETLAKRGSAFRSLGDRWADTTTQHGRPMLTVLGGLAEFERESIRIRTGEGRSRAKARGVHMGRPAKLTPHQWRETQAALADGTATQSDLARRFHVSQSTISRLAKRAAPSPTPISPTIDPVTRRAARSFLDKIESRYPVRDAFLFGSRARRTHRSDSDADIAVVLKGARGNRHEVTGDMAETAFDVMLETGVLVQAVPLWEDEVEKPEQFSNPMLIENIKRDGLRL